MFKIYLGSSSPRRKELLHNLVADFSIIAPHIDESILKNEQAEHYCTRIAKAKMQALLPLLSHTSQFILITCDTTVSYQHHILGKPQNLAEAREMLSLLSGRTHQVITTLALTYHTSQHIHTKCGTEITSVTFKNLSSPIIETYIASVHVLDKAGAYAIQENGTMLVHTFKGSYSNVIGFPLRLFYKLLAQLNLMHIINPL